MVSAACCLWERKGGNGLVRIICWTEKSKKIKQSCLLGMNSRHDCLYCANSALQITFYQNLQQFIAINLANQRARMIVVGDISGIFGQNVADDLVDWIVAFFFQCMIDRRHNRLDLFVFLLIDIKLTCQIYHTDSTFLAERLLYRLHAGIIHVLQRAVKDFCDSL